MQIMHRFMQIVHRFLCSIEGEIVLWFWLLKQFLNRSRIRG